MNICTRCTPPEFVLKTDIRRIVGCIMKKVKGSYPFETGGALCMREA